MSGCGPLRAHSRVDDADLLGRNTVERRVAWSFEQTDRSKDCCVMMVVIRRKQDGGGWDGHGCIG